MQGGGSASVLPRSLGHEVNSGHPPAEAVPGTVGLGSAQMLGLPPKGWWQEARGSLQAGADMFCLEGCLGQSQLRELLVWLDTWGNSWARGGRRCLLRGGEGILPGLAESRAWELGPGIRAWGQGLGRAGKTQAGPSPWASQTRTLGSLCLGCRTSALSCPQGWSLPSPRLTLEGWLPGFGEAW